MNMFWSLVLFLIVYSFKNRKIENHLQLINHIVFPLINNIRVLSSCKVLYSNVEVQMRPKHGETFINYENRIKKVLNIMALNERHCFYNSNDDCLSYNRVDSRLARKPYIERDLLIRNPQSTSILLQPILNNTAEIVIGISTAESQFAERMAIRRTWCSHIKVCCFFSTAKHMSSEFRTYLEEEAKIYNDILQTDIVDSYLNLTIIQLQAYKWALSYFPNIQYYIRSDSDMYMNITRIVQLLPRFQTRLAYGYVFKKARPFRKLTHKYYMPVTIYSKNYWPPYISGCMTIFSKDVLGIIVNGFNTVKPIHYLDDAYYGQILEYYRINITEENKLISVFQLPLRNIVNGNYLAVHRLTPIDILTIDLLLGKW